MHIKRTKIEMSSKDMLSIINEYVDIPNLKLSNIFINDSINVEGSYKIGGRVTFSIRCTLISYNGDSVILKLDRIKLGRFGIFNIVKRFALNKLLTELKINGILCDRDIVTVEIKKILDKLPFFLNLDLEELKLGEDNVIVVVENINFSMKKVESIQQIKEKIQTDNASNNETQLSVNNIQDGYSKVRKQIENRVPSEYAKFLEYALILPDIISLFYRLFRDERVPLKIKVIVGAVITYLASPVDILPDFIPFVGKIDDLALIFYALNKVTNNISMNIIEENWQGDYSILEKVKASIKYVNIAAGGTKVDKLFKFILKMYEFSKVNKDNYYKEVKREK